MIDSDKQRFDFTILLGNHSLLQSLYFIDLIAATYPDPIAIGSSSGIQRKAGLTLIAALICSSKKLD